MDVGAATELDALVTRARETYARTHPLSGAEHQRASKVLPGGNTRSVLDFAPFPFRVTEAHDGVLVDIDGHRYVDFCGNYTAGLLGHSPPHVREAIDEALDKGWALGAIHEREAEVAELICKRFSSIDQVRFTNSGTEANLMAIGTALHHTQRHGVGVFDSAYHGGVLAFGNADRPHNALNVPHRFHVAPFDDRAGLDALFDRPDLGCVLVEAVQGAGGCRPASHLFMSDLRRRCTEHDVVLIMDEVMTSRLAPGGAQERYAIDADMTTLGKYLGGGMTFGAFGGRRDIMAGFDPAKGGTLTQAGTFNNNVVSMAAAAATLRHELDADMIREVNRRGDRLRNGLDDAFFRAEAPLMTTGLGSMITVHADDDRLLELWFHAMLEVGYYVGRRGFIGLSRAITDHHCDAMVTATERWARTYR